MSLLSKKKKPEAGLTAKGKENMYFIRSKSEKNNYLHFFPKKGFGFTIGHNGAYLFDKSVANGILKTDKDLEKISVKDLEYEQKLKVSKK